MDDDFDDDDDEIKDPDLKDNPELGIRIFRAPPDADHERVTLRVSRLRRFMPRSLVMRRLRQERIAKLEERLIDQLAVIEAAEAKVDRARGHLRNPPPLRPDAIRPLNPHGRRKAILDIHKRRVEKVRQGAKATLEELATLELGEERRRSVAWRWITLAIAIAGVLLNFRHH